MDEYGTDDLSTDSYSADVPVEILDGDIYMMEEPDPYVIDTSGTDVFLDEYGADPFAPVIDPALADPLFDPALTDPFAAPIDADPYVAPAESEPFGSFDLADYLSDFVIYPDPGV